MFRREMKVNFKGFIVWTLILIVLFLAMFLVYPSIISSSNIQSIDEMMKIFPEDLLKAFNMDIASLDSAFGWLKTEGFVFVLLITGVYSAILGSSILLKEESDKTIEYLNSIPVKRNNIVISKVVCGFIYIFSMIFMLGLFNYISLLLSGDFNQKLYLILSITPLFSSIVIFTMCLFLSTFTHKTKKTFGLSLGIVFASYFLQVISELSEKVEFLKYFSAFTLADIRNVIVEVALNPFIVIIAIIMSILFIFLTLLRYNKKELV